MESFEFLFVLDEVTSLDWCFGDALGTLNSL